MGGHGDRAMVQDHPISRGATISYAAQAVSMCTRMKTDQNSAGPSMPLCLLVSAGKLLFLYYFFGFSETYDPLQFFKTTLQHPCDMVIGDATTTMWYGGCEQCPHACTIAPQTVVSHGGKDQSVFSKNGNFFV
jgi:hypothetical protein